MPADNIEKANAQWRFIVDAIPALVFLIDAQGLIVRANRTLERWQLGDVAGIRGRSLHDALHPDCRSADCYLASFTLAALSGQPERGRFRREAYDPVLQRHLAFDVQPAAFDGTDFAAGEVCALVAVNDQSELKRQEEDTLRAHDALHRRAVAETEKRIALEEVQTRVLGILAQTPNFIAMTALDGTLLHVNPAGRAMLQLAEDDLEQLNICDFMTPEATESLQHEVLPTVLRNGVWQGASTLLAGDGHAIPTTRIVIAHRDQDDRAVGFSFIEQDMTEWVRAEAALRDSQDELRQLSAQLINVQEEERRRIASDLHDVIGQSLSLIKLSIDNAGQMFDAGSPEEAKKALLGLSARTKEALVEVRRIAMDLRPTTLDDLGILPTLRWFFREFEAACREIRIDTEFNVREESIPDQIKTTIFRLLQEATSNIVKHAGADHLRVELTHRDGLLALSITDNGRGFDPALLAAGSPPSGLGLRSMKERARLSGGSLAIASTPGQGTCIRATWPLVEIL